MNYLLGEAEHGSLIVPPYIKSIIIRKSVDND